MPQNKQFDVLDERATTAPDKQPQQCRKPEVGEGEEHPPMLPEPPSPPPRARNRDFETPHQLHQLASYPRVTPARILTRQAQNELAHATLNWWTSGTPPRLRPVAPYQLAVPTQQPAASRLTPAAVTKGAAASVPRGRHDRPPEPTGVAAADGGRLPGAATRAVRCRWRTCCGGVRQATAASRTTRGKRRREASADCSQAQDCTASRGETEVLKPLRVNRSRWTTMIPDTVPASHAASARARPVRPSIDLPLMSSDSTDTRSHARSRQARSRIWHCVRSDCSWCVVLLRT